MPTTISPNRKVHGPVPIFSEQRRRRLMTPFAEIPLGMKFNVNSLDADHSFDELPDLKVVTRVPAEWDRRPSETWHGYDGRIRGTLTTFPREGVDQHPPGRQGCSRSSIDYNLDLALGCCQWKLMKWEVSASCWQPVALVHLSLTSTFHLPKTFRVEAPHLCNSGPGRYAWNYYNPCPVI